MCFSMCAAVIEWTTMALELALTSGDDSARETTQLAKTDSFAQCRGGQVGKAAGTWLIGGPRGPEGGGVIFTLAESHFEKDAAFQDLFI